MTTPVKATFSLPLPTLGTKLQPPTGFITGRLDPTDFETDKQFCVDPLHAGVDDCLRDAEAVTDAQSGDQTCLFVGLANASLGFQDIVSVENIKAHRTLERAILSAKNLWDATVAALEPSSAYFAKHAPEPLLTRMLECYLYFGTTSEARNAALVLLARNTPLTRLLQLHLVATPTLAWFAKRMQERGMLGQV